MLDNDNNDDGVASPCLFENACFVDLFPNQVLPTLTLTQTHSQTQAQDAQDEGSSDETLIQQVETDNAEPVIDKFQQFWGNWGPGAMGVAHRW